MSQSGWGLTAKIVVNKWYYISIEWLPPKSKGVLWGVYTKIWWSDLKMLRYCIDENLFSCFCSTLYENLFPFIVLESFSETITVRKYLRPVFYLVSPLWISFIPCHVFLQHCVSVVNQAVFANWTKPDNNISNIFTCMPLSLSFKYDHWKL